LRYGDAASEVASLALDLDLAQRSDLADELLRAYVADTDDAKLPHLLRFYKCHRAVLRGKFEILVSLQRELPIERRILARSNASGFFALAESHITGSSAALLS
jgi:aminoglycoside phosphotransferase family enzyme